MEFSRKTIVPGLGSKWLCIEDFSGSIGRISYQSGKIYKSNTTGKITDDCGNEYFWIKPQCDSNIEITFDLYRHFRQLPRNKRCAIPKTELLSRV